MSKKCRGRDVGKCGWGLFGSCSFNKRTCEAWVPARRSPRVNSPRLPVPLSFEGFKWQPQNSRSELSNQARVERMRSVSATAFDQKYVLAQTEGLQWLSANDG